MREGDNAMIEAALIRGIRRATNSEVPVKPLILYCEREAYLLRRTGEVNWRFLLEEVLVLLA